MRVRGAGQSYLVGISRTAVSRWVGVGLAAVAVLAGASVAPVAAQSTSEADPPTGVVASSVDLRLSPGVVGPLRMGSTIAKAKKVGMLEYGPCGWEANKYIRYAAGGNGYFYTPERASGGLVKAYSVEGSYVRTTRGLKQGDRLSRVKTLYPGIRKTGTMSGADYYVDGGWRIYTTGSRSIGWLDVYVVDHPTDRFGVVDFFVVRAGSQAQLKSLSYEC